MSDIPPLKQFTASVEETKTLPGLSTDPTDAQPDPGGGIGANDQIGDLAIAALYNTGVSWYFTNGRYNDNDWKVDRGTLQGATPPPPTYTFHEALRKHTECCLGSKHGIFYRFPTKEDYLVYALQGGALSLLATVPAASITVGAYTRVGSLTANDTVGTRTLVFSKASQPLSTYTSLGAGVEAATIADTPLGRHVQLRYTVTGKPFDTVNDYKAGPASGDNRYGQNRQFFGVSDGTRAGTVWQSRDDGAVFVTWIGADPAQHQTLPLPVQAGAVLAAATSDGAGNIYTFMVQEGDGRGQNGQPDVARVATLYKAAAATGAEVAKATPDTGPNGLNIVEFGTLAGRQWGASLEYANGVLGLIIGRTMHKSPDGLNHQAGIVATYDANTLQAVGSTWQSSSHSWESVLTKDAQNRFVGLDLGDNFPRGVHLHRFDQASKNSRVIYTYKTKHGEQATNPAGSTFPLYKNCPSGKVYYQWSNDNETYTELGGLAPSESGIVAAFTSERTNLDSCIVGQSLNAPRNLGLMLIRNDFENATTDPGGSTVVTDDLVLSQSDYTVEGEYYTFGGSLRKQRNRGVVWLTDYPADLSQSASRVKFHPLGNGDYLILWEIWGPNAYVSTYAMSVKPGDGSAVQVVQAPYQLSSLWRLNRRDDLFEHAANIYSVAGNSTSRQLVVDVLVRGSTPTAGIAVTSPQDVVADDGQCTLREAVNAANTDTASGATAGECAAGSGADQINLPAGIYTLSIAGGGEEKNATGDLDVLSEIRIQGAGADMTYIQAGPSAGSGIDRVLHLPVPTSKLDLYGVTVRYGKTEPGSWPNWAGAGIFNHGTLGIYGSVISENGGTFCGGALYNYNGATMNIVRSTLAKNTGVVCASAIQNDSATVNMVNVTVSGNTTSGPLGALTGVKNLAPISQYTIINSTIANNLAAANDPSGGLTIYGPTTTATVHNTILHNNSGTECIGAFTTGKNNLIDDSSCGANAGQLGAVTGLDPALQANGGKTLTHALLPGSNAIDAGDNATCAAADQRGIARPQGTACDVGAYEAQAAP